MFGSLRLIAEAATTGQTVLVQRQVKSTMVSAAERRRMAAIARDLAALETDEPPLGDHAHVVTGNGPIGP